MFTWDGSNNHLIRMYRMCEKQPNVTHITFTKKQTNKMLEVWSIHKS